MCPTDLASARAPPVRRRRHPPRLDGGLGLQGVHLRHAVPEVRLGRVRGGAAAGHRRPAREGTLARPRRSSGPSRRRSTRRSSCPSAPGGSRSATTCTKASAAASTRRWRSWSISNRSLDGVLQHIDFNRKVGQSTMSDKKLRELIMHFNKVPLRHEGLRVPRPARRRLRVPDPRLRRLRRQEGRRVLHAPRRRPPDGADRSSRRRA